MMKSAKNYILPTRSLKMGVREWGDPDGTPVVALHGWLDNAATFDRVAPGLEGIRLISIDHAGHALSEQRPAGSHYQVWEYTLDMVDILDALELEKATLMGHSLGAIVLTQFAATFPERVERLGLIEGLVPMTSVPEAAPDNLAQYAKVRHRVQQAKPTIYSSRDKAIEARMNGFVKLGREAATILAERGVFKADNGFYWHNDSRLKLPTAVRMDQATGFAFVQKLAVPTLLVLGEDSGYQKSRMFPKQLPDCLQLKLLPGGHHLHLEQSSDAVAEVMNRFLKGESV
ncbi:alpha/beta fold hydrolase [Spongorhabdus nitratireducens]